MNRTSTRYEVQRFGAVDDGGTGWRTVEWFDRIFSTEPCQRMLRLANEQGGSWRVITDAGDVVEQTRGPGLDAPVPDGPENGVCLLCGKYVRGARIEGKWLPVHGPGHSPDCANAGSAPRGRLELVGERRSRSLSPERSPAPCDHDDTMPIGIVDPGPSSYLGSAAWGGEQVLALTWCAVCGALTWRVPA